MGDPMPRYDPTSLSIEPRVFHPARGPILPQGSRQLHLLCRLHTMLPGSSAAPVLRALRKVLDLPSETYIVPGFRCLIGNIYCGRNVGLADTVFLDYVPVYLEDYANFSYGNLVVTTTHDYQDFSTVIGTPIVIERNVWITCNVTILAGVRIGHDSVIGAGSVVTKDVPPCVFAAGNPCKPVRTIERGAR